ncbi:MAG: glycogen debranching enzyme family protein [Sedimentisphaerales bacterium]|nr:glycogen debranching enzyme family protein [Sedimentisphaerales bacterium]
MLTLQKTDSKLSLFHNKPHKISLPKIFISTAGQPVENLLTKEWLLTNERGSYASSTIIGCNTLGYHGLLIGSLNPPVNRIMALANCLETVIINGKPFELSTFEFNNKFTPTGYTYQKQFRQDFGVHFNYELDGLKLTKSVYLLRDRDTVALVYNFIKAQEPAEFILRPFIGLRDFHTLQQSHAPLCSENFTDSVLVRHNVPNSCELFLSCPSVSFTKDRQWWFNFVYRNNKERGQDFTEDLWTPGFFKQQIFPGISVENPFKIVLWATLSPPWSRYNREESTELNIDTVRKNLLRHQEKIKQKAYSTIFTATGTDRSVLKKQNDNGRKTENRKSDHAPVPSQNEYTDEYFEILCLNADAFISKRQTDNYQNTPVPSCRTTILAGYPWFADWGRDAFISLPGLLLSTGRFDEAKSVLTTFASAADEGMIPNRFDDRSDTTYFNSIDASLWFINAAFQYYQATGDSDTFNKELLPAIHWIIESYHNGTRFGIHADTDGLITAGDYQTQLTWMDAKFDGVAFTPRYGKAVEVNALWYNALCLLARHNTENTEQSAKSPEDYKQMADKVCTGFRKLFWNKRKGCLNDCILPDGTVDDSLRPNQIFAVSLPFSPLTTSQQKAVVKTVQNHLLTPYGLRTLNAKNNRYKGIYTGPQQQRDEAYHQGTVWAFLLGPFVESYLKVNGFSRKSRKKAAEFIQPLLKHLTDDCCLGSVSEIFDGDKPHKPKGCFAQAWSVAELIRAYGLIYD